MVNIMIKRRKESRNNLPWSVAPIPTIPVFPKTLTTAEVVERLDHWHAELEHWLHPWRTRNTTFFCRLLKIEDQIRLLIKNADEFLPDDVYRLHGVEKRSTLAQYHELLARCLSSFRNDETKGEQAITEFKNAISLAPAAAGYWYSYVRHLVMNGSVCQALDEINAIDVRHIETEKESIAH